MAHTLYSLQAAQSSVTKGVCFVGGGGGRNGAGPFPLNKHNYAILKQWNQYPIIQLLVEVSFCTTQPYPNLSPAQPNCGQGGHYYCIPLSHYQTNLKHPPALPNLT